MSALAEAPSRNGDGPKHEAVHYRDVVKAKMKKRQPGRNGPELVPPTDAEVTQFLIECRLYDLEPLAGQIYAAWENGAMRAVTTNDGLRVLAERTERYDGQSDPEWCDRHGNWTDYWPGEEKPLAARVRVHKKGTKVPTTGTANWHDFAPQGDLGPDSPWMMGSGKPAHVLSMRAEAIGLRKAFPAQLSGLYTAEELGISLAAIGAAEEEASSAPAVALDVPPSASLPPAPAPPPPAAPASSLHASGAVAPAVIVDEADGQPSGAPARPQVKRTLAEALASGDYQRLRAEMTETLFDQMPDRLTDEQSEVLAGALSEAEEAGITPVELERLCKIALKDGKGNVDARLKAVLKWISERRRKAEADEHVSAASDAGGGEQLPAAPEPGGDPQPSLLDDEPASEPHQ